jgi:hypothetical protein
MSDEQAEPIDPPPSARRVEPEPRREAVTIDASPESAEPPPPRAKRPRTALMAALAVLTAAGAYVALDSAGLLSNPAPVPPTNPPEAAPAANTSTEAAPASNAALNAVAGDVARLAKATNERLAQIQADVSTVSKDARPADSQVDRRLTALEQTIANRQSAAPVDPQPIMERLSKLEAVVSSAGAKSASEPFDQSPIEARLAALEQGMQALREAANAAKSDVRATETAVAAAARQANPGALAAVAQAIARAIEAGVPFSAEFAAAKALGASDGVLGPLRSLADKGAPSAAALATMFAASEKAALTALAPSPPANASPLDRLAALASNVVRVRPAGERAGDEPAVLVPRIETSLARGAVGDAVEAWNSLPQAAREASKDFGSAAKARLDAERAAAALNALAMNEIAHGGDSK